MKQSLLLVALAGLILAASLASIPSQAQSPNNLFVPFIGYRNQTLSPYGVQSHTPGDAELLNVATQLHAGAIRYAFLNWRDVQPREGGPYNWAAVASFDQQVRAVRQRGIEPLLIVGQSPAWATIPLANGSSTSCAALRDSAVDDFAAFMAAAAARYAQPEFGVRYWELGNEVDVDPTLVSLDSGFGCWGDIGDPYYGGERYGRMLTTVTPAIKAANPHAQVVFGGLLLDSPNTTAANRGKPERFLEGALRAAPDAPFDVLPYHAYPAYRNRATIGQIDYDTSLTGNPWVALGGSVIGKARYLRSIMDRYGVQRALWLNETSLMCPDDLPNSFAWCRPPVDDFYQAQADFLVRTFVRALNEGIEHIDWYSLETVWRQSGLLDKQSRPKPAFNAYLQLSTRLGEAVPLGTASYGSAIEGYRFRNAGHEVQVVWAVKGDSSTNIDLPLGTTVNAFSRDGQALNPQTLPNALRFTIGFSPVFLVFGP